MPDDEEADIIEIRKVLEGVQNKISELEGWTENFKEDMAIALAELEKKYKDLFDMQETIVETDPVKMESRIEKLENRDDKLLVGLIGDHATKINTLIDEVSELKALIKASNDTDSKPPRDCDKCYLYSECDHRGAYQKDGKWCYEEKPPKFQDLIDTFHKQKEKPPEQDVASSASHTEDIYQTSLKDDRHIYYKGEVYNALVFKIVEKADLEDVVNYVEKRRGKIGLHIPKLYKKIIKLKKYLKEEAEKKE